MGNISQNKNIEISIHNLVKKFGDLVAVNKLSLDIYKGEIIGILGPNGAGKTTTINVLCGISPPTEGEVIYNDCESTGLKSIKGRLGICPQENIFWPKLTCKEQLIFMARMYNLDRKSARSRADYLMDIIGLDEKANVLARKLSGGMKRRLSISLALVHDPDILVLDEPEAGLDPQSRILVRKLIKDMSQNKTIILTTHNMDEADRLSDRVVIIDFGKILQVDTPANLKKTVGEGDLLEFSIEDLGSVSFSMLNNALTKIDCSARISNDTLLVKSRDIMKKVSYVTNIITSNNLRIRGMTMRGNTLEDVFIHLTGRKLRE